MLAKDGITAETGMPPLSAHTVTVPGAAAGWVDSVEKFGSGKVIARVILGNMAQFAVLSRGSPRNTELR